MSVAEGNGRPVRVEVEHRDGVSFLTASGVLDATTYRGLRDAVIKAALDEPRVVIVDVNDLSVASESAWSVFTSARWHVSIWPDVPILLVSAQPSRRLLAWAGQYMPVHPTRESALAAVADRPLHVRRRARTRLPADPVSIGLARRSISDWLTAWAKEDLIPVASTVATIFTENVLVHTGSAPVLRVENNKCGVTVAVEDGNRVPAARHEDADRGAEIVSGLAIVAALCRAWGSAPTPSGKTVWAVIGRENLL